MTDIFPSLHTSPQSALYLEPNWFITLSLMIFLTLIKLAVCSLYDYHYSNSYYRKGEGRVVLVFNMNTFVGVQVGIPPIGSQPRV